MSIKSITLSTLLLAVAGAFALPSTASAGVTDINSVKKYLEEGKQLWADAKDIQSDYESLSSTVKAKLKAKKQRFTNAAKSFEIVFDRLKAGNPLPWYITKPSGQTVSCGDKIYLHNVVQDKVLRSEYGSENKTLNYIRVNLGFNGKETLKGPNITVQCRDKSSGVLSYGDVFTLKVDPDTDRADGKNLDDGKPYFHAGTKVGYEPVVRLGDKAEIDKWGAYWKFRGGEGEVQTGIPLELIATNRGDNANILGFCGSGPAGAVPVIKVNASNHCTHVRLAGAAKAEEVATPPQWTKDLLSEVKTLAKELREDIKKAREGGDTGGTSTPTTTKGGMKGLPGMKSGLLKGM
jgi:hypothetical protein